MVNGARRIDLLLTEQPQQCGVVDGLDGGHGVGAEAFVGGVQTGVGDAEARLLARSCGFDRRGGLTGEVAVSLPV